MNEQPLYMRFQELFWALPPDGVTRSKLRALEIDTGRVLADLAEKDAELLALRAAHAQLRKAAQAMLDILTKDGTWACACCGHTEPHDSGSTCGKLALALAASPPHPETEGP